MLNGNYLWIISHIFVRGSNFLFDIRFLRFLLRPPVVVRPSLSTCLYQHASINLSLLIYFYQIIFINMFLLIYLY
jgi:hypothetical protein